MQTFLPYQSFQRTARVLDQKRLGKQRVETMQIMSSLTGRRLITSDVVVVGERWVEYDDGSEGWEDVTRRVERDQVDWEVIDASGAWANHPAARMWAGREGRLLMYQEAIVDEWLRRGFRDSCMEKTRVIFEPYRRQSRRMLSPRWLGNRAFHRSHQSNLVAKLPEHYRAFFPNVPDDLEYIWPEGAAR